MKAEPFKLTRGCLAIAIPSGEKLELRQGESVVVSQALGGSFTVVTEDGTLVRVASADADAVGQTPPGPAQAGELQSMSLEERVWAELRTVYDPEIPVDIVELGLVYRVELVALPPGGSLVQVAMTMTAPGCGMGEVLREEVVDKLRVLPGVEEVRVELVLDPPWDLSRMSEAARLATGVFL